ncbi:MAG: dihydroorotase [Planctomycetes bacterium]|nr:dihydroorotase [Planctomycetota bacterium]
MNTDTYDLIISGGTVVNHAGRTQTDVAIRAGRFAAIGDLREAKTAARFDARGLTILPGVIDTQVHMREPGLEHKEDLASGSAGAALGGVTGVFEMPNTKPSTTTAAALQDKLDRAAGRMWVDHAFYMGGCAENADQLAELERVPGCSGVKVFMGSSTGSLLVADDATLDRVLRSIRRRMAVHCEDEPRLIERRSVITATGATAHLHPVWRDELTALRATTRLVTLARKHGKRVHTLHITTAEEMDFLRENRDIASVEVLANHLTLAAPECYDRLGAFAVQNPPVRDERHRAALWAAVNDGTVDVVATDHAPHTKAEKDLGYPGCPAGMPGVQTLVGVMLDHVAKGRLSLERLVDLTSAGAQRLFGLVNKGRIACGYDADLTIVDLNAKHTITNEEMATKAGWTPFAGMTVQGWPMATIIRGNVVMRDGQLIGKAGGVPMRFLETLTPT